MAVFFSVVSKMVSNIDIFQGIVSKLVIPVSWQHYIAGWLCSHIANTNIYVQTTCKSVICIISAL